MFKGVVYALLGSLLLLAPAGRAEAQSQQWNLVNPAGVVEIDPVDPAPRLTALENKTIALRWNGKHNGNVVLDRLAELLAKEVPSAKVIKTYEVDTSLNSVSRSQETSASRAQIIADLKPDLLIASQAD